MGFIRAYLLLFSILLVAPSAFAADLTDDNAPGLPLTDENPYVIDVTVTVDNLLAKDEVQNHSFCYEDAEGALKCYDQFQADAAAFSIPFIQKCTAQYECFRIVTLPDGTQFCEEVDIATLAVECR